MPNDPSYDFPAELKGFLTDFRALLQKHPGAAGRFVLADVGADAGKKKLLFRGRPTEWECVSTEWGVVCKPLEPIV